MRERARSRVVCLMIMNHFTERRGGNYPSLAQSHGVHAADDDCDSSDGFSTGYHDTMMASVFGRSSRLYFLPSFLPSFVASTNRIRRRPEIITPRVDALLELRSRVACASTWGRIKIGKM